MQSPYYNANLTFEAATCNVKPETGKGVLLDIRDWISRTVSDSLETLKRMLILVFVTVNSLDVSGTEDAKSHSSSSLAALVVLCVRFVVGAEAPPPSKSTTPEAGAGGLTDCWYWKGEACRGVEARAANGSGVRAGCGGGVEKVDRGGDATGGWLGFGPAVKRLVMAWLDAFCGACDCGTAIPDMPRTENS